MQQIRLNHFFVNSLQFERLNDNIEAEKNSFDFHYVASFYSQKKNDFFVEFSVSLKSATEFSCEVDFAFIFQTTEEITEEFIKSHFPIINAPAIAFPFIRTFISNFSLNSGYRPSILPAVNFTKVAPEKVKVFFDGELIKG